MSEKIFRTIINPKSFDFDISYHSKIMFIGSCFTENIGNKLNTLKFNVNINPFGIIYNPISAAYSLNFIVDKKYFKESDLFFYNEYWHSFYHHGRFSDTQKTETLKQINNSTAVANAFLKNTDFLFITLGTTWVYEFVKTGQIVANCHKIPADNFNKRCLTENEITEVFIKLIKKLRVFNGNLKIIFSVSPVRYLKDGFSKNFLSKAILRTATEKIKKSFSDIYYFPAHEILNDDLRDYRFYDRDLVHPNEIAVDYIFDFFRKSFFTDETLDITKKVKKIIQSKTHRIFNKETQISKQFINSALKNIEGMKKKYPFINLKKEEAYFNSLK